MVELAQHPHLTPTAALLHDLWQPQGKRRRAWCTPSTRRIAEILGRSRRTIMRHLKELQELRLIRITHRASKGWKLSSLIRPGRRVIRILRYVMGGVKKLTRNKEAITLHPSCNTSLADPNYKYGSDIARQYIAEWKRMLKEL